MKFVVEITDTDVTTAEARAALQRTLTMFDWHGHITSYRDPVTREVPGHDYRSFDSDTYQPNDCTFCGKTLHKLTAKPGGWWVDDIDQLECDSGLYPYHVPHHLDQEH